MRQDASYGRWTACVGLEILFNRFDAALKDVHVEYWRWRVDECLMSGGRELLGGLLEISRKL